MAGGCYDEALRLHEETLAAREDMLGPDHPSTLEIKNNLAIDYSNVGRIKEAIRMHEETLAARVRVLGPDHPDTIASRGSLTTARQPGERNKDDN